MIHNVTILWPTLIVIGFTTQTYTRMACIIVYSLLGVMHNYTLKKTTGITFYSLDGIMFNYSCIELYLLWLQI